MVHGCSSRDVDVLSVATQGFVVGPPLFLIYMSDIISGHRNKVVLFAADQKICLTNFICCL